LFAAGTLGLAWFVVGLATGRSLDKTRLLAGGEARKKVVEAVLN
jgi:hypothetical protein